MANYQLLKADIDAKVYENAYREITGENLNSVLNAMVTTLGEGYQFAGVATKDTNPEVSDAKVFYIANGKGTYTNFGGINVTEDEVVVLYWDTAWHKEATGIASQEKVDENAILYNEEINLTPSSPYYIKKITGAWMTSGKILQNQYTTGYEIYLFSIPAGVYYLSATAKALAALNTIVGVFDSEEDFVISGHISQSLIGGNGTEHGIKITQNTPILVGLLSSINYGLNYFGSIAEIKSTTIKESVHELDSTVPNLENSVSLLSKTVSEMEGYVPDLITSEYVEINKTSHFYENILQDAFITSSKNYPNGIIIRNDYTHPYSIVLYRVPAGNYRAIYDKTINYGVVLGVIDSENDLNVNGVLSEKLVDFNSERETHFAFTQETLIVSVYLKDVPICKFEKEENRHTIDILEQRVETLEDEVGGVFDKDLDIVIPDVVYAIVGTELNIYNDAVSLSIDRGLYSPLNYQIRWSCSKGTITDRCFRFTPVYSDVGNVSCTCYLYDIRGILVGSKTFTIKVLAKNVLTSAKNLVYFGDSLGPAAATALYNNFHDTNRFGGTIPKMLGTKGATKNYEAVGGYTWRNYATAGASGYRIYVSGVTSLVIGAVYSDGSHNFEVYEVNITDGVGNCLLGKHFTNAGTLIMPSGTLTKVSGGGDDSVSYTDAFQESANPLWNDTTQELDINQYKQTLVSLGQLNSVSDKIDAVSFQFGINDHTLASDLDTLRGYISDLYNLFIGDNANCKFIVGLTTSSGNDVNGSGANYGAAHDWKAYLKNTYTIRKFYLSLLTDFPNMRIATPNLSLDRYYGYALGTRQVSNRCTETEQYHTNYVHPGTSGYEQMADAYLACYVAVLTES